MRHIIHGQLRPVMLFPTNDAPVGQMYICFHLNMMLTASPVNPKQLSEVAWLCYVINLGPRVTQLRRFPRKPRQMCLCFPVNMMLAASPVNPKQLCEAAWLCYVILGLCNIDVSRTSRAKLYTAVIL